MVKIVVYLIVFLGRFCGDTRPKPIKTSKNTLKIEYQTRNIQENDGFELLVSNEKTEGLLLGCEGRFPLSHVLVAIRNCFLCFDWLASKYFDLIC